jgi:metacaspase-1
LAIKRRPVVRRGPAAPPMASATGASLTGKHLVYVHGICHHDPGYSDSWWAALKPFVTNIPDENRHEVLWSQIIDPGMTPRASRGAEVGRLLSSADDGSAEAALTADIVDALTDRAQRDMLEASFATPVVTSAPLAPGGPPLSLFVIGPQAASAIPQVECIRDFSQYLLHTDVRSRVLACFTDIVEPLLAAGASVEVIAHSWGTVVAYEALRSFDGRADLTGSVLNLFTPGSALSIPQVKRRLLPQNLDGRRPAFVKNWVNLDARFEIVGGHLRGDPFAVDYEYLNLPPVGCSAIIPTPWCAHGSYFNKDNLPVNRDIFGSYIA